MHRREFLGLAAVTGLEAAAFMVGCAPQKQENRFSQQEAVFFQEIEPLPVFQKVQRIDQFFSINRLSKQTAVAHVLPIWTDAYIQASSSSLTREAILSELRLTKRIVRPNGDIEEGHVETNWVTKTMQGLDLDIESHPSNVPYTSGVTRETASGIVLLRNGAFHEYSHFDTLFREGKELAAFINERNLTTSPIDLSKEVTMNAFTLGVVGPEGLESIFFNDFDEAATDVINHLISKKIGVKSVMAYPIASYIADFLSEVGYDPDRYIAHHRNSELDEFATDLGALSAKKRGIASSQDGWIEDGMKVVTGFQRRNQAGVQTMDELFPGVGQAIFTKAPVLIR